MKFLHDCRRVIRIAKKPNKGEYLQVAKVTGLGILLIGFIGFIIMLASYFIQGMSLGA